MIDLMTPDEIAAKLKMERRSFLRNVANQPDFPPPVRLGQKILRWHTDQIEQWVKQHTQKTA